jgi:glycosyltransferase involved in cell wall biosynthesis
MNLTIVLPVYNEEKNIELVMQKLASWYDASTDTISIIFVDDGSTDHSALLLKAICNQYAYVLCVTHETNKGYGAAVRTGLDAASTEWIGFMDSDDQFEPSDFNLLIKHANTFDAVAGYRANRADSTKRKVFAWGYGLLSQIILGVWKRDMNCAMKIMKRSVWTTVRPTVSTGGIFNAELFFNSKQHNVAWKQVPVPHYPRHHGQQTGGSVKVVLQALSELVKLRFFS